MNKNISTLEDALVALGAKRPFDRKGYLTHRGMTAYNKLRNILGFMKNMQVVSEFDEDRLDEICNDTF